MRPEKSILPLRLDGACYDVAGARLIDGLSLTLSAGPRTVIREMVGS